MATVEKRGKSWRLIAYLGYDANNNQRKRTKSIPSDGVTKAEAKRLASAFENNCLKKGFINDKNLTLAKFIDYWKKEYATKDDVYSPKTLERNEQLLKRIIPALGHIRLTKLKPTHLMEFYNNLREDGIRLDGKKGKLSPRTIQMHHKLISSILNKAKQWQFLETNPCQYVDAPKSKSKQAPIYDEATLITFFILLFKYAKTKYQLFFLIAFSTGLRRGEILGLRDGDIDEIKNMLQVNQELIVVKGGLVFKLPKTEKSSGWVSMSPSVMPVFQQHKYEQGLLKERAGDAWPKNDLIFTTADGNPMFPSTVTHWLKDFIAAHHLPPINVHSFRHMSVTYALDRGFDLKAVSERARHTQVSTTVDIYGHVLLPKDQAIAASLDGIIQQAKTQKPIEKDESL